MASSRIHPVKVSTRTICALYRGFYMLKPQNVVTEEAHLRIRFKWNLSGELTPHYLGGVYPFEKMHFYNLLLRLAFLGRKCWKIISIQSLKKKFMGDVYFFFSLHASPYSPCCCVGVGKHTDSTFSSSQLKTFCGFIGGTLFMFPN